MKARDDGANGKLNGIKRTLHGKRIEFAELLQVILAFVEELERSGLNVWADVNIPIAMALFSMLLEIISKILFLFYGEEVEMEGLPVLSDYTADFRRGQCAAEVIELLNADLPCLKPTSYPIDVYINYAVACPVVEVAVLLSLQYALKTIVFINRAAVSLRRAKFLSVENLFQHQNHEVRLHCLKQYLEEVKTDVRFLYP